MLSTGAEQPLGRRVQNWVLHQGWHPWASLHSCHLGLGVATAPQHADGTAVGDRVCMNARVMLQAGGISAARFPAESFCLESQSSISPASLLLLASRLLAFCVIWKAVCKAMEGCSYLAQCLEGDDGSGEWALLLHRKSSKDFQR